MLITRLQKLNPAKILFLIGCVLISVWPALYNRYPLVNPDSGTYIGTFIPMDRPFGYHLFLFISSLHLSLWFPILSQGIITVWLLARICKMIFKDRYNHSILGASVIFVSIFTSMPWYTSQLTPDSFCGLYLLALIIFFFKPESSKFEKTSIGFLLVLFGISHTSNFLIGFTLSLLILSYSYIKGNRKYVKKAVKNLVFCAISFILIGLSNIKAGYGFCLSPVSHMFIMSRMAEDGILDKYLASECATDSNSTSLCQFRDKIGDRQWDFMWNDQFPHYQKGWIAVRDDYNHVIFKTLLTPKLFVRHCVVFVTGGLAELGNLYIGDGIEQSNNASSNTYVNIEHKYSSELKAFKSDLQNSQALPIKEIGLVIYISTFSTILFAILCYSKKKEISTNQFIPWKTIFLLIGTFIFLNAFISAEFSTVIGRFNARVFWVLPLFCFLYLMNYFLSLPSIISGKIKLEN